MAEATFNRELGAAPAGITRFGQFRTDDGSNITIDSFREFAGDGAYGLSDVYSITYGVTGIATLTIQPEAFAIRKVIVLNQDGSIDAELDAPKISRNSSVSVDFNCTDTQTGTVYVVRSDRSATEYRVTLTAV